MSKTEPMPGQGGGWADTSDPKSEFKPRRYYRQKVVELMTQVAALKESGLKRLTRIAALNLDLKEAQKCLKKAHDKYPECYCGGGQSCELEWHRHSLQTEEWSTEKFVKAFKEIAAREAKAEEVERLACDFKNMGDKISAGLLYGRAKVLRFEAKAEEK